MDKPRSVDKSFLFATVDFIPKSVTQREDHGIKVTSLSISWDYFSKFWVICFLLSQWIIKNVVRGRATRARRPAVSIANVVLKRPTSSSPPAAGCKIIVLLNLLVLIYSCGKTCSTNAPHQLKKRNCKLPRMGSHSQLPIALILQTLPVLQISCLLF